MAASCRNLIERWLRHRRRDLASTRISRQMAALGGIWMGMISGGQRCFWVFSVEDEKVGVAYYVDEKKIGRENILAKVSQMTNRIIQ